jgi:hypothetical protein
VVDTVGAGDGFAVGVISALLEGRSVVDAVQRGSWIGARAVQVRGDTEGLPTRAELEQRPLCRRLCRKATTATCASRAWRASAPLLESSASAVSRLNHMDEGERDDPRNHFAGRADPVLVGALPSWGYSRGWGYGPSGGLGLVLLIVIVLLLLGKI